MRRGRLGDEAALRGGAEGGVPVLLSHLVDRPRLEAVGCRVDDKVEAAELAGRALDGAAAARGR